ncbi:MAG: flagellar basal body rod protein FlgC [Peptococcaceae bacterium]|nr:flagellar basal body rod protein FlgC [Peptococcaceae bacterium]
MSLFQSLDISGSGLTAERLRMDLIANNIANVNTTRTGNTTASGNQIPYQREVPEFESRTLPFQTLLNEQMQGGQLQSSGDGVEVSAIVNDPAPFKEVYDPSSPDAIKVAEPGLQPGYVRTPNVEMVNEMVDMISASRAYEANVTAINAGKSLVQKALTIGQ